MPAIIEFPNVVKEALAKFGHLFANEPERVHFAEYLTGQHTKNRIGLEMSYFLPGVEFGGSVDWLFGEFQPEFLDYQNGQIVRLDTSLVDSVATPLGNIDKAEVDLEQYRLKAFMKVSF